MAKLSFQESLAMTLTLLQIPLVLVYASLFGRWSKRANGRPLNRVLHDEIAHFVLSRLSIRQLQAVSGSSLAGYSEWARQKKIAHVVDELGNEARLMWVSARDMDYVVIYCHGGGFQTISKKQNGVKLGVAILQYSLHPESFPTQLDQFVLAVQHVMAKGVPPARIFLAGDSAGGNLVLQLLSHIRDPSALASTNPSLSNMVGFRGVCLLSPWVMSCIPKKRMMPSTWAPAKSLRVWQEAYMAVVPDSHRVYIQPAAAPSQWFDGPDEVVGRVLVTVGSKEVLRDSIQDLAAVLQNSHRDFQLDVQEGGVHCDPMFDIAAKSTAPHPVEQNIIEWFAQRIEDRH
ncbi:alpha beta-hydrolase [Mycena maculata]|uniref:Alpha beta-hydrolase n=1 Tax=Mycena maculata TaxID=230809 RepID=A0AAD7MR43_9AGAR|nr:alpha beta-hydrolase [Mycena maculata]